MTPAPELGGAYLKASEQELDLERFDQPAFELAEARHVFVICSTQRSGSWLLCRQLLNAGLGVPSEYFHSEHVGALSRRWRVTATNADAYLDALWARRTTPNGVWGTKLQWPHYVTQRSVIDERLWDNATPIFLYRSDLLAQAVSLHISLVTGIWGFDGAKLTAGVAGVRLGEHGHVAYCAQNIQQQNALWQALFKQRGLRPLLVRYEDFARQQTETLQLVAERLGIERAAYRVPLPEPRENSFPADIERTRQTLLSRLRQGSDSER